MAVYPSVVCLVDKPSPEVLELILGKELHIDCERLTSRDDLLVGDDLLVRDYARMRQHFCARKDLVRVVRSEFWDDYFKKLRRRPDESEMYNIGFDDSYTLNLIKSVQCAIYDFKKTVVVPPGFVVAAPSEHEHVTEPTMRVAALEHLIVDREHMADFRGFMALREKFGIRDTLHVHVAGEVADFEGFPKVVVRQLK